MEVQRFADKVRVDNVVINLRQENIKAKQLYAGARRNGESKQRAGGRGDCRADNGDELPDGGQNGKYRRIRQIKSSEIKEDKNACDQADG